MRRESLPVPLALEFARFYSEELSVRERCSFSSCLRSRGTLFLPVGVRKQELKIVGDPDTLHNKKSSFSSHVAGYLPLLIRKRTTCYLKTEGVNHSIHGNLKYRRD